MSSTLVSRSAEASPTYPPLLENAVSEQIPNAPKCAPQCTACHLTTEGGFGTLNKFGHNLQMLGGLLPGGSQADVTHALKILVAADPDSDGDGIKDVEEIEAGDSPALAAPNGVAQWCPDIKYGCSARIAAAPPAVDGPGLFSAARRARVCRGPTLARPRDSLEPGLMVTRRARCGAAFGVADDFP